jgi:cytochrome c oxidase assembly protein subunit 15
VTNAVMGWPLFAALAHTAGAAGLVIALTWILSQVNTSTNERSPLSFSLQHRS